MHRFHFKTQANTKGTVCGALSMPSHKTESLDVCNCRNCLGMLAKQSKLDAAGMGINNLRDLARVHVG